MKHTAFKPSHILGLTCSLLALTGAGQLGAAEAPVDVSGVWQWGQCTDGTGFDCMLLEEDDELLTQRARALRDALDEAAAPKYDCAPMSIPHMWTDPYSHQIEQFDDRIVFTYGKDDVVRTAWLPDHAPMKPAPKDYFIHGWSLAHYDGNKLIVETTHFAFDPQGLNADFKLASTTQKKVIEEYSRDGENLILKVTTTDPFMLREPWVYEVRSRPDPEPVPLPWGCDPEGARESLKLLPPSYPNDPPVERLPPD